MKRLILFLVITSFLSCNTKTPVFEIYQEVSFLMPAGKDPIATHHFIINDIPSFLNSNLTQRGLKLSDLKELYAGYGKLESIVYDSNFGVIDRISVWIYIKGDYDNRMEIYYHDEIPYTRKGELKLLSTGEDAREVLLEDKYEMDVEIQFRGFTSESIETRLTFSYVAYTE